jgi:hypothetical protein
VQLAVEALDARKVRLDELAARALRATQQLRLREQRKVGRFDVPLPVCVSLSREDLQLS